MTTTATPQVTLPAGAYYIGDPSAVIMGEDWRELCRQTQDFTTGGPLFEFRGVPLVVTPVRSGDGIYTDNTDCQYIIGSGLLGVVPCDPFTHTAAAGRVEEALRQLKVTVYDTMIIVNVDDGHEFSIDLEEE